MGANQSAGSSYFKTAFGYSEAGYEQTQLRLLEAARFEPADPTIDLIDFSQEAAERVAPPESCTLLTHDQRELRCGTFYEPSVNELRSELTALLAQPRVRSALGLRLIGSGAWSSWSNVTGDAFTMHQLGDAAGCVFQVASQFNYLEFPSPEYTPEHGITGYANDHTQGPACAMACPAGTAYRNYLIQPQPQRVSAHQQRGQRAAAQRNALLDVEDEFVRSVDVKALKDHFNDGRPWVVRNGYIDSSDAALESFNAALHAEPEMRERLIGRLRVGVQQDTEVAGCAHAVTQAYCSALSITYARGVSDTQLWKPAAQLVLDGAYEATLLLAAKNVVRWALQSAQPPRRHCRPLAAGPPRALLTKLGAGVFGNRPEWVRTAMIRAHRSVATHRVPLDVRVVHHGHVDPVFAMLPKLTASHSVAAPPPSSDTSRLPETRP